MRIPGAEVDALNASVNTPPTDMSFGGMAGRVGNAFGNLATDPLFMTSLSMLTNDGVLSAGAAQNAILMTRTRAAAAAQKKAAEAAAAERALAEKVRGGAYKQMRAWLDGAGVDPTTNPEAARLAVHAEAAKSPKPMDKRAIDQMFDSLVEETASPVTAVPQPGGGMSFRDPSGSLFGDIDPPVTAVPQPGGGMSFRDPSGSLFGDIGPQTAPPPQISVGPEKDGRPAGLVPSVPGGPGAIFGHAPQPQPQPPAPHTPPLQGGVGSLNLNPRERAGVEMGMQFLRGTQEQATVGQKLIHDILGKNRQIAPDVSGFQRDVRTGQRVFPEAGNVGKDGRELPFLKGSGVDGAGVNSWFKGEYGHLPDTEYASALRKARSVFPKILLSRETTKRNADGSYDTTALPGIRGAFESAMRDGGPSPRGPGGSGVKRRTMPDGTPMNYRTPPPLSMGAIKTVNFGLEAARLLPEAVGSLTHMMTSLEGKVSMQDVLGARLATVGGLVTSKEARRYERSIGTVAEGMLRELTGATANETEDVKNDRRYKWAVGETFGEGLEKIRNAAQLKLDNLKSVPLRTHVTRGKRIRQAEARLEETVRDINRILGKRGGDANRLRGADAEKAARLWREYGD
jgi:hypothetical protein